MHKRASSVHDPSTPLLPPLPPLPPTMVASVVAAMVACAKVVAAKVLATMVVAAVAVAAIVVPPRTLFVPAPAHVPQLSPCGPVVLVVHGVATCCWIW